MDTELSELEQARYSAQIAVDGFGARGQERLKDARVLVVGAGPVGAGIAAQLVSCGVGYVAIVDGATVSEADLAGQTVHFGPDVGTNKADSVASKLGVLNSGVQVDPYPVMIDADNADAIVVGHDMVFSSFSDKESRLTQNDSCVRAAIPMVAAIAAGSSLSVQTTAPEGSCLRCAGTGEAAGEGLLPGMAGLAASIAAFEGLRRLVCDERLPDRAVQFDATTGLFDQHELLPNVDCELCSVAVPT